MSELVESPPLPNPLRASFARLDPASGEKGESKMKTNSSSPFTSGAVADDRINYGERYQVRKQRIGLQLKVVDNGCSGTGVTFTGLYRDLLGVLDAGSPKFWHRFSDAVTPTPMSSRASHGFSR